MKLDSYDVTYFKQSYIYNDGDIIVCNFHTRLSHS